MLVNKEIINLTKHRCVCVCEYVCVCVCKHNYIFERKQKTLMQINLSIVHAFITGVSESNKGHTWGKEGKSRS